MSCVINLTAIGIKDAIEPREVPKSGLSETKCCNKPVTIGCWSVMEDSKIHLLKLFNQQSHILEFIRKLSSQICLKKGLSVLQIETNGMIYNVIKTLCSKK